MPDARSNSLAFSDDAAHRAAGVSAVRGCADVALSSAGARERRAVATGGCDVEMRGHSRSCRIYPATGDCQAENIR